MPDIQHPLLPPPCALEPDDIITSRRVEIASTVKKGPDGDKLKVRRYLKAIRLLNLPPAKWSHSAMKAVGDFASYMDPQQTAAVLLHSAFLELEQLRQDCNSCRAIAEDKDNKGYSVEDRLTAVKRLTEYLEAYRGLLPEVLKLAEKANPKGAKRDTPLMNLPPQVTVPVQVNVGGVPSPAPPTPATAGNLPPIPQNQPPPQ